MNVQDRVNKMVSKYGSKEYKEQKATSAPVYNSEVASSIHDVMKSYAPKKKNTSVQTVTSASTAPNMYNTYGEDANGGTTRLQTYQNPVKYQTSDNTQKGYVNPNIAKLIGTESEASYNNATTDLTNKNGGVINTVKKLVSPKPFGDDGLTYLSETEKAYLAGREAQATEDAINKAKEEAQKNTLGGIARNVYGGALGSFTSALGTAVDKVQGNPINPNASYNRLNLQAQAAQQALQDKAANAIGAEDGSAKRTISDLVVGSGLSALQTINRMPMGAMGAVQAGLSAGTNAMIDAKNNGGTDKQAFAQGVAQGLAEGIFEKISLSNLKALSTDGKVAKNLRDAIMIAGHQMVTEGSEEMFTDWANDITDRIIMGDKSAYVTKQKEYEANGMTESQAKQKAFYDLLGESLLSFAGGAISGLALGTGGQFVGQSEAKNNAKIETKTNQYNNLVQEYQNGNLLAYDKNTKNSKYSSLNESDVSKAREEAFNNLKTEKNKAEQETVKPLAKAEEVQNQQNNANAEQNIQNTVEEETPIEVDEEVVKKAEAKASFKDFLQTGNQNIEYKSDLINSLTEEEKNNIRNEVDVEREAKAKENAKETKQDHVDKLNQIASDIVDLGATDEAIDNVLNEEFEESLSPDDLDYITNRITIEEQIRNAVEDYNNGNTKNLNEKYGAAVLGEASKRVGENQNIEAKTNTETSFEYEAQTFKPSGDVTEKTIKNAIKTGMVTVYANEEIKDGTPISLSRDETAKNGSIYTKRISINDAVWKDGLNGGGVYGTSDASKSAVAYSKMPKPLPKVTNVLRETRSGVDGSLAKGGSDIVSDKKVNVKKLATAEETASKVKGENNERNNVSSTGKERNIQERAGEQVGRVSEGSGDRTDARTGTEQRKEKSGNSEKDAKEVIPSAKEGQKVSIVSKENDTKETAEARKFAEDCGVKNVTIINSDNDINTTNGSRIRAWWNPKTDEVGAIGNSKKEKVIAFVKHELTERAIGNGKVNVNEVSEKIASVVSVEDYNKMLNGYLPQNFENLSDAQQEEAINEAVKELVCDAYGGINQFKNHSKFADLSDGMSKIIDSVKADANEVFAQKYDSKSDKDTVYSDSTKVSDSAYMKAVESGDTETAQKMVDEAAKKAGYIYKAYHGTNAEFNVFDKSKLGEKNFMASSARKAFFASESKETAENYTGLNSLDMMSLALNDESKNNMLSIREKYRFDDAEKSMKESRDKFIQKFKESTEEYKKSNKKIEDIENRKEEFEHLLGREGFEKFLNGEKENADYNLNVKYLNEANREFEKTDEYEKYKKISEKIASEWEKTEIDRKGYKPNVKNLLIKMENPLIHDYKKEGRNFDDYTDSFSQFIDEAKKNGNDGCIFKNVQDGGDFDTIYAVFDSNQFKSADPVTYDDKGNVIPLSERFNSEKNDIRYSSAINDNQKTIDVLSRYNKQNTKKETGVSFDEVKEAYNKIRNARNYYENSSKRNNLSSKENSILNLLMNGEMSWEEATRMDDVRIDAIKNVFEAKREYDKLTKTIKQHKAQKNSDLAKQADDVLDGYETWKDKKIGILYDTTTAERNIEDIAPLEKAKEIIKNYFTPVKKDVKKTNDYKTAHRNVIRELNLSRKIADGNTVSESEAVQFIGEALDNLSRAANTEKVNGKTQVEWQQEINNFWKANPNLDKAKIENAIDVFRKEYDSILSDINDVRIRNGYEPIPYRQGYFMHFQDGEQDTILTSVKKAFGIETESVTLPTTINGLTEFFKPGIKWAGFALQRKGNDTKMDAVQGFDRYIETAADIVFLTDDIQRLRALAKQIRYNSSDDAVKEQIDKIMASDDLDSDAKSEAINSLYANDKTYALSNYVAWLDEYTNQLAGKKSRYDRAVEAAFGRNAIYKTVKNLNARLASNMVAVNPASWVTNFIPLTQAITTTDAKYIMKGMVDTLKNVNDSDGLIDRSTYLTNRLNESERLVQRGEENANPTGKLAKANQRYTQVLNKIADKGNAIDSFTTEAVYRARYLQDIANGMNEVDAIEDADDYTARLQADRSKGSTPTIFGATNPLIKTLTMFQLEVKNELDWAVKDVPKELKDKALGQIVASVMKFLVGTYLFNDVYEYFIGRRPAVDPLNLLNDTTGDLTGYKLPNMIDYALGEDDFKTKKRDIYSTGERLLSNVAEELPFVGGIMGGGRVPISSALPSASKIAKAATDTEMSSKKRVQDVTKELTKPIAYLALPGGGSQIKKTYEGAKALKEGGSYIYDKGGNRILQYPIYKDSTFDSTRSGLRSLVFGKTANKTARDWIENDFKSLSANSTDLYDGLKHSGLTDRKAFRTVNELNSITKTEDESANRLKMQYIVDSDMNDDAKRKAYISLYSGDNRAKAETEITDAHMEGIKTDDFINYKLFKGQKKNGKSPEKSEVMSYIDSMKLTIPQKDYLYLMYYEESTIDKDAPWRSGKQIQLKKP